MFQIIKITGWKWDYVLWKVSWLNIQMMLADQPSFKKKEDQDKPTSVGAKGLADLINSRMKGK